MTKDQLIAALIKKADEAEQEAAKIQDDYGTQYPWGQEDAYRDAAKLVEDEWECCERSLR